MKNVKQSSTPKTLHYTFSSLNGFSQSDIQSFYYWMLQYRQYNSYYHGPKQKSFHQNEKSFHGASQHGCLKIKLHNSLQIKHFPCGFVGKDKRIQRLIIDSSHLFFSYHHCLNMTFNCTIGHQEIKNGEKGPMVMRQLLGCKS